MEDKSDISITKRRRGADKMQVETRLVNNRMPLTFFRNFERPDNQARI